MTTTVEDAQFLNSMNLRVIRNKEAGKPLRADITEEEYQRFLTILRPARAGVSAKATPASKKKVEPMSDEGLKNLFNN